MKRLTLTLFLLFLASYGFAQKSRIIKGIIHAKGSPSEAITAQVYETSNPKNLTISSPTGDFAISVPLGKVSLTIKSIDGKFQAKSVIVPKNKKFITVGLEELIIEAEEDTYLSAKDVSPTFRSTGKASKRASESSFKTGSVERSVSRSPDKYKAETKAMEFREETDIDFSGDDGDGLKNVIRNEKEDTKTKISPQANLLTAGELDDFSKWEMWQDISKTKLNEYQKTWEISPLDRYTIQLTTEAGFPIVDAKLQLKNQDGQVIWETRTDNTGKGELWNDLYLDTENQVDHIEATIGDEIHKFEKPSTFHKGINTHKLKLACNMPDAVDIAFVVDATASMDDEIDYLKVELESIINKVKDSIPSSQINLGSVFYRDYYDSYLTIKSDFSENVGTTIDFIKEQSARGGGDFPEAVDEGLLVAINELKWSESAKARLLFLVLDAPPHENSVVKKRMRIAAQKAAQKGIRIIPITASGIDKSTEYLMRSLALATNGTYTFLTDDSGIGNGHIKPTTDKYTVELLNDLLVRLILEYTHSSNCEQIPINHLLTTIDTVIHTDTLLTLIDTIAIDTINIDSAIVKVDPVEPLPIFTWKYYPNPTSGKITVELSEKVDELFITDISGKLLVRIEPKTDIPSIIDLSPYPTGIYFIKFMVGEQRKFGRVLLTRDGRPQR